MQQMVTVSGGRSFQALDLSKLEVTHKKKKQQEIHLNN